jgi:hypothetical protein
MKKEILSTVEEVSDDVLMAMLHFSPNYKNKEARERASKGYDRVTTLYDAAPFFPQNPVILHGAFCEGRLYSASADYLMTDPSSQMNEFEHLCISSGETGLELYRWFGIKKRKTRPRAFIRPGCDVFWESCQRIVYKNGREDVQVNVFGWNKAKKIAIACPIPQHKKAIFQGTERNLEKEMARNLVLSASIVEDMKVNWSVTIRESSAFTLYSTEEKIKELCALRDAPMTESGRRAAICHWVRGHRRKTQAEPVDVRKHLRGVTQFPMGSMQITVTPPSGFCIS